MVHHIHSAGGRRARSFARGLIFASLAAANLASAQTTVDLRTQSRNVDFSNASATRVWKTGNALPATCNAGEGFFLMTAEAGRNLYLCTAANTWTAGTPTPAPTAGTGSTLQTVNGPFVPNAVPIIDGTSTEVSSGCTAISGSLTCAGGFNGGVGATRITASEGTAPASPATGQQTLFIDSGDHNLKSVDSASTLRQYATLNGTETLASKTLVNPSLGVSALTSTYPNESTTGTTAGYLAKLTGNPGSAVITTTSDTGGAVGIAVSGAGKSGSVEIAITGQASCVFDGATVSGDYVSVSPTVAGTCHDAGATYPLVGQVLGRALSTNAAGGLFPMTLFGPEVRGGAGGAPAASFNPLDTTTAWIRDEMFENTHWFVYSSDGGGLSYGDQIFGDALHPGVLALSSGGSYGANSNMWLAWGNSAMVMHYPGASAWEMVWVAKLSVLTDCDYEFGFVDQGGHDSLKIAFDSYNGANWKGISRASDVETSVDLGVVPTNTAFTTVQMRSDMTKIYFSVNGSPEQTICPVGCTVAANPGLGSGTQVWPYAAAATGSSTVVSMGIDLFALQLSGITR